MNHAASNGGALLAARGAYCPVNGDGQEFRDVVPPPRVATVLPGN